jgi:hypothetical protein
MFLSVNGRGRQGGQGIPLSAAQEKGNIGTAQLGWASTYDVWVCMGAAGWN